MKKTSENKTTIGNFFYAFNLMLKLYPEKLWFTVAFNVIGTLLSFFSSVFVIRYVVNGLQLDYKASKILGTVAILFLSRIVFEVFNQLYALFVEPIIGRKCYVRLKKIIYTKASKIRLEIYDDSKMYDLINRAMSKGPGAITGCINLVVAFMTSLINLSLCSWLIIDIDPFLLVFALLPLLFSIVNLKADRLWYNYEIKEQRINRKLDYTRRTFYLREFAKEMRLTKICTLMIDRFRNSIREKKDLFQKEGIKRSLITFIYEFGAQIIAVLGGELYALYNTVVTGTILYGDCLVVLTSIGTLSSNIQSIASITSWVQTIGLNIHDYKTFIELTGNNTQKKIGVFKEGDIEFKNVSFSYQGGGQNILSDVSVKFSKGEKVAIVGHNGAGKTTLLKLLLNLYEPCDGIITVGGVNLREMNDDYKEHCSVVFQDVKHIAVSVAENVLGRKFEAKDEVRVIDSLKRVGLWDIVSKHPKGIHAVISKEFDPEGILLSGGESQKLALASIYARDADIIVMDEPTSMLDPVTERHLLKNLIGSCADKTVVYVSHRLSSAVDADRILVMQQGKIIEEGTHKELMNYNGFYAEMFNLQAEHYV